MNAHRLVWALTALIFLASSVSACLAVGGNIDIGANIDSDLCGELFLSAVTIDVEDFMEGTTRNVTITVDNATLIDRMWVRYDSTDSALYTGGSIGENVLEWDTNDVTPGTYTIIGCANDSLTALNCTTTGVPIEVFGNLNRSQTSFFNTMVGGRPFQAARDVYTTVMGGLFWAFIIAVIFFAFWFRTQNLSYSAIVLILMLAVLNVDNYIHPDTQIYIYGIIVVAMGLMMMRMIMSDE